MAQIALDAMGGDLAPTETVAGALAAAGEGVEVLLVGDEIRLKAELADQGGDLPIVHAPDEVGMGEDAARALRQKPNSSISVCARLVHDGEAKAFVSAGSTGAAMAAAAIIIGRLPGVLRPTIASIFPTPGTPTVVLDSGANPEVKAQHLVQFALMGSAMAEVYLGMENPRVGLLNIGEEPGKGRGLDKQAFTLLRATSLNFVGNVEGRDLATNRTDVIVTDGFTGNVFLKTTEGAAQWVTLLTLEAIVKLDPDFQDKVLPVLGDIRRDMDYEHHGGGHLLGVDGVVVIAHGSSTRVAIANSLAIARDGVDRKLVSKVAERIVRR